MPGTEALRNLICHTHKLIVVVNINHAHCTHTHTHNIYPWLGPVKSGRAVPPHFSEWGATAPPARTL